MDIVKPGYRKYEMKSYQSGLLFLMEVCYITGCSQDAGQTSAEASPCSNKVIDYQTDRAHCGTCGHACDAWELCIQGKCEIDPDYRSGTEGGGAEGGGTEGGGTEGGGTEGGGAEGGGTEGGGTEGGGTEGGGTEGGGTEGGGEIDSKVFSIIVIPDSQHYTETDNSIYHDQLQWIVDHKDSDHIKMVLHLGDLTQNNYLSQWESVSEDHKLLDEADIPYTVIPGNHDFFKTKDTTDQGDFGRNRCLISSVFHEDRFKDKEWFNGIYHKTSMSAKFEVAGHKFLVISLEYHPRKDALCWAEDLIRTHQDHHVILTTHGYLMRGATQSEDYLTNFPTNWTSFGATGTSIYNELAGRYANVIMVIGGHIAGSEHRMKKGFSGNSFLEVLTNFQFEGRCQDESCVKKACVDGAESGNGWMQKITIDLNVPEESVETPQPNVFFETFTVLDHNQFYEQEPQLYCSSISDNTKLNFYGRYPSDPTLTYSSYIDFFNTPYAYTPNASHGFAARNVNETSEGMQTDASVSMNRLNNDFASAWLHQEEAFSEIRLRLFCSRGCARTGDIVVAHGNVSSPEVVMDGLGNVVVTWLETSDTKSTLWGLGFRADGSEWFPTQKLTDNVITHQAYDVDMNIHDDLVMAYESESMSWVGKYEVTDDGFKEVIAPRQVSSRVTRPLTSPAVAIAKDGSYIVTYLSTSSSTGLSDVAARSYYADGSHHLESFSVNLNHERDHRSPAIVVDDNGGFYIVYEEDVAEGKTRILLKGFDTAGTTTFSEAEISAENTNNSRPKVSSDKAGNSVVATWSNHTTGDGEANMRVLKYNRLQKIHSVGSNNTGYQGNPDTACDEEGRCVFVYEDDNDQDGNKEVFAIHYQ